MVETSPIVIPRNSISFLREAARVLQETYRDDDFEVFGYVVGNESFDPGGGGQTWIFCEVGGQPRKVRLHLDSKEYFKAVNAHQADGMVRCRGQLEKEGRFWTLKEVRGFQIAIELEN